MGRFRLGLVVSLGLLAVCAGAASASHTTATRYQNNWLSYGESGASSYDRPPSVAGIDWCTEHFSNDLSHSAPEAYGTVGYIDSSGGWRYTLRGTGNITRLLTSDQSNFKKKAFCRQSDAVILAYWASCYVYTRNNDSAPGSCFPVA